MWCVIYPNDQSQTFIHQMGNIRICQNPRRAWPFSICDTPECSGFRHTNTPSNTKCCCCQRILYNQPDFLKSKTSFEEYIKFSLTVYQYTNFAIKQLTLFLLWLMISRLADRLASFCCCLLQRLEWDWGSLDEQVSPWVIFGGYTAPACNSWGKLKSIHLIYRYD